MERRLLALWVLVAPRNLNPQASLRISLLDEERLLQLSQPGVSHLAQPGASFLAFALFMGISMTITAFLCWFASCKTAVFSRRRSEAPPRPAPVDDLTAWSMLAFVVAIARATSVGRAAFKLGLVLVFITLMLFVIKPKLPSWLGQPALERPDPSKAVLALVLGVVLVSALTTELIGISPHLPGG